ADLNRAIRPRSETRRKAVLGLEQAAGLRRERLRHGGGRREPLGDDDRTERLSRSLLRLERSSELLLRDQAALQEQRAERLGWRPDAVVISECRHGRFPHRRRCLSCEVLCRRLPCTLLAKNGPFTYP